MRNYKSSYVVLSFMIVMASCALFWPKDKSEYCASRIALLRDNVYLSDSANMIYKVKSDTNLFILLADGFYLGKNCLKNWNKREIRRLIGRPSVNYEKTGKENIWRFYFIFDKCGQPGAECPYWDIKFDNFNRVKGLKEGVLNRKPDGRP